MALCRIPVSTNLDPGTLLEQPDDNSAYAAADGIRVLQHLHIALPNLSRLHLHDSPVMYDDIGALAAALHSFSSTITHLHLDVWKDKASSASGTMRAGASSRPPMQSRLNYTLSSMRELKVLCIRDWEAFTGRECGIADTLLNLPGLQELHVDSFPCGSGSCGGGSEACLLHPPGLPFVHIAD